MKRIVFAFCFFAASLGSWAQTDVLPAEVSDVKMTPIFHASVVLEWNGKTIYVDPYNGAEGFKGFANADVIVITHAHGDHMSLETLGGFNLANTIVLAPESVASKLGGLPFKEIISIKNGQIDARNGIGVEAVPMYNLPDDESSRHKKGWGNGYIITLGGQRFYFSGDTEDIAEMRNLQNIDYAFVCMNLPYTMTVEAAASAVLDFKPKHVYPFHYRGGDGEFSDIEKFRDIVNKTNPNIDVRLREWYN